MAELLEALQAWPDVDVEALRSRPEWKKARAWGWVTESGEFTGTGLALIIGGSKPSVEGQLAGPLEQFSR